MTHDLWKLLILGGLSVLIALIFGGNLQYLRKMKRLLWIFIGLAIVQSIFLPTGRSLITIGDWPLLTLGGVLQGVYFLLRIVVIMIPATVMLSSSSREIVQGFVQLRIPYEIAFMVSVAIRFLPLLKEEITDSLVALQLRGIVLNRIPLGQRIKIYTYLVTPVLMGVIHKAQELSMALEMRAFRAYPTRTSYLELKLGVHDYLLMIGSCACVIIVLLF